MNVRLSASLLPLLTVVAAHAQDDEVISTERPSFSSSPVALSPSVLQIEFGYQFTHGSGGNATDHTLPLTLFRAGLAERLELHVGWAGVSRTDASGGSSSDVNGALLGAKWQLTESDSSVPIALFGGVTIPVDSDDGDVGPILGAFWSASAGLAWFGTVLWTESDRDRVISNALGASFALGADTGGYVEYFGLYREQTGPENYVNAGVSRALRRNLAVDAYFGVGLNDRSADYFLGFGVARRF